MLAPADIEKLADALALRLERIIQVVLERPAVRRAAEGMRREAESAFAPDLVDKVLRAVSAVTGVSVGEMTSGGCRGLNVTHARDVAAWALRRSCHGDVTMKDIGEALGTATQNARQSIARVDAELDTKRERGLFAHRVALRLGIPGFGTREDDEQDAVPPSPSVVEATAEAVPLVPVDDVVDIDDDADPMPEAPKAEQETRRKAGRPPKPRLPQAAVDRIVNFVLGATRTPRQAVMSGHRGIQSPPARGIIVWLLYRAGQPQNDAGAAVNWDNNGSRVARKAVEQAIAEKTELGRTALRLASQLGLEVEVYKAA